MIFSEKIIQPNPKWGAKNREIKAINIFQTISHFFSGNIRKTTWLDIGCGNGGIAAAIACQVSTVTAVDPEEWQQWDIFRRDHENLFFINKKIEQLSLPSQSFDIVICNQVYEHVRDPNLLIKEIYRMLKPGGYCYFAGPNYLFPVEPHVFLPFIHWLPRSFALKLLKILNFKGELEANSENYWTLKDWLSIFEVTNAVPYIVKNPSLYGKNGIFWALLSTFSCSFLEKFTWASPGFVFILRKQELDG